jgi:hypothetical protein
MLQRRLLRQPHGQGTTIAWLPALPRSRLGEANWGKAI